MNDGLDIWSSRVDSAMNDISGYVGRAVDQVFWIHQPPHLATRSNKTPGSIPSRDMIPHQHIHAILSRKTMGNGKVITKGLLLSLAPLLLLLGRLLRSLGGLLFRAQLLLTLAGLGKGTVEVGRSAGWGISFLNRRDS